MKQFRFKTKLIAQFFLVAVIGFSTLVGCKSYDQDIEDLNGKVTGLLTDVAALKTSVAALETSVSGMTYIKSITMGTDGKLTITPSVGSAIIYDAKSYVTYDIKLEGNNLIVNGANKGTVAIPALTFDNGLLKSGTTTVADLTSWLKSGLTVVDGFLAINGQKTSVAIPAAADKTVKEVALDGTNVKVTYTDNTSTVFANAPIVTGTSAAGTLLVNGVDTGVKVNNTYSVIDGFLAVNGVKTTVAIPAGSSVIIDKVDGVIVSATVSDGTDTFTIKLNPTNELLSSILFVPTWINNGLAKIEVGYINGITVPVGKVLFNEQNLVYRFNPTTADVSKTTWKFINTRARVDAPGQGGTPGDQTSLFDTPTYTSNNDGSGTFKLKVAGTWPTLLSADTAVLIALQANGKDFYSGNASSVVSDYAKVVLAQYNAFISDSKKSNSSTNVYTHYRTAVPAIGDANDFELVVNTPVDLKTLVWATADKGGAAERRFETYGFNDYKYEFSLPTYLGTDNATNQNSFVSLNTDNVLSVNTGSSVLDRNPLVLVKLLTNDGKLVAQSYIKFKIVATPTLPPVKPAPVKYTVNPATYNYPQLFVDNVAGVSGGDFKEIILSWADINAYVYNPLGLTHNQYVAKYGGLTPTITVKLNDVVVASPDLTIYNKLSVAMNGPDVDTYAMKYLVTPKHKFGKTTITYKYDTGAITDAAVEITFEFTINKPALDKTILEGYRWNNSAIDAMTQGVNDGTGYQMKSYIGSAFTYGSPAYRNVFGSATAGKIDDATHTFQFKVTTPAQTGAVITPAVGGTIDATFGVNTTTWSGQVVSLTSKLTDVEKVYAMQLVTTYPNADKDVFDFNLHFVNPFSIELASPSDFQLIDKVNGSADTQDVKANYIVKFKNTKNIITKGVPEVSDGANSVKASDYVDLSDASLGLFYELTPSGNYFTVSKAGGNAYNKQSVLTWDGAAGITLNSEQKVGTVKVKFVTNFAEVVRASDDVTVKPE